MLEPARGEAAPPAKRTEEEDHRGYQVPAHLPSRRGLRHLRQGRRPARLHPIDGDGAHQAARTRLGIAAVRAHRAPHGADAEGGRSACPGRRDNRRCRSPGRPRRRGDGAAGHAAGGSGRDASVLCARRGDRRVPRARPGRDAAPARPHLRPGVREPARWLLRSGAHLRLRLAARGFLHRRGGADSHDPRGRAGRIPPRFPVRGAAGGTPLHHRRARQRVPHRPRANLGRARRNTRRDDGALELPGHQAPCFHGHGLFRLPPLRRRRRAGARNLRRDSRSLRRTRLPRLPRAPQDPLAHPGRPPVLRPRARALGL